MITPSAVRTWFRQHGSHAILVIAIGLFLFLSMRSVDALPTWHEEISVHPSTGYRVFDFGLTNTTGLAQPRLRTWCGQTNAPTTVLSPARPVWSACIEGKTFPIMVTSYFSGIPYWILSIAWPYHHGDIFLLRQVGLLWGVLTLITIYMLVTLIEGQRTAALTVLFLSVTPPFVYAHTLALYYEVVPSLVLSVALIAWIKSKWLSTSHSSSTPPVSPSLRWLTFATATTGFAIVTNFKAIFLIVPLVVLALRARLHKQARALTTPQILQLLGVLVFALAPMIFFAYLDPSRGLQGQVNNRLAILLTHLQPWRLVRELVNLLTFWSDIGFYEDLLMDPHTHPGLSGLITTMVPLLYCTAALVRALVYGQGPWLAAGCGALLWQYVLLVVLLYDQYPSANYAILHSVFGLAWGCTFSAGWRWLRAHVHAHRAIAIAITILFFTLSISPLIYNCVRLQDQRAHFAASINAHAERTLAQTLRAQFPSTTLLTTTYNLAGVLDSLGHGQLHPIQAQVYLHQGCTTHACMQSRWTALLQSPSITFPLYVVIPMRFVAVDEPTAPLILPTLQTAAAQRGFQVSLRARFTTTASIPVVGLYQVTR